MNDIIQNTNEAYLSWNLNFFFFDFEYQEVIDD